jgi:hypothetical protein
MKLDTHVVDVARNVYTKFQLKIQLYSKDTKLTNQDRKGRNRSFVIFLYDLLILYLFAEVEFGVKT